jgi:hypothetical protein
MINKPNALNYLPYLYIGLTSVTGSYSSNFAMKDKFISSIRKFNPGDIVCVTNPHPSYMHKEYMGQILKVKEYIGSRDWDWNYVDCLFLDPNDISYPNAHTAFFDVELSLVTVSL